MISFVIPGDPVAMGRPRFATRKLKSGKSFSKAYTDKKSRAAMSAVAYFADAEMSRIGAKMIEDGPIFIQINCGFSYPKAAPKKMLNYGEFRTKKPDVDNLAKLILDGCNGVCWKDDAQISILHVSKVYSKTPQTIVVISEINVSTDH